MYISGDTCILQTTLWDFMFLFKNGEILENALYTVSITTLTRLPAMENPDQAETRNLLNITVKLGSMICFCRRSSVSLSTLLSSSSTGLQSDQNQTILRNNNHINYKQQFLNTLRTNFVNPIRYLHHNTRCIYWKVQSEVSALNVYHVLEQNANITSKIYWPLCYIGGRLSHIKWGRLTVM